MTPFVLQDPFNPPPQKQRVTRTYASLRHRPRSPLPPPHLSFNVPEVSISNKHADENESVKPAKKKSMTLGAEPSSPMKPRTKASQRSKPIDPKPSTILHDRSNAQKHQLQPPLLTRLREGASPGPSTRKSSNKMGVFEDVPEPSCDSSVFLEHSADGQFNTKNGRARRVMQQGLDGNITLSIDAQAHDRALQSVPAIVGRRRARGIKTEEEEVEAPPPSKRARVVKEEKVGGMEIKQERKKKKKKGPVKKVPRVSTKTQAGSGEEVSNKNTGRPMPTGTVISKKVIPPDEDEFSDDPLRI